MHQLDLTTISVNDIIHTLCECERNANYDGQFDQMLVFASELTGLSVDRLCSLMHQKATREHPPSQEINMLGKSVSSPHNLIELHGDTYAWALHVWGGSTGELWDRHKKEYISKEDLPSPLLQAHDNLWEQTGDDYLVEYQDKYYYMLDHIYNEHLLRDLGLDRWSELYNVALKNAVKVASHEALKDTVVLVARKSGSLGPMHVVSVLVSPQETKVHVDRIREILNDCMFKLPEKVSAVSFIEQVQSAATRAAVPKSFANLSLKEQEPEL